LLAETELEATVPLEWMAFAREHGLSRNDVDRLRVIELHEGEYRLADGTKPDMRVLELMLLLNDGR
jgi:hypothetical protein